jgi:ABC-type nickel/cobalt efflux system permease component RcnA
MGNFSVNRWTRISVVPSGVRIVHLVDFAEIPTRMELSAAGLKGVSDARAAENLGRDLAGRLLPGLVLEMEGARVPLRLRHHTLEFVPGAAGLPTMRLTLELAATISASPPEITLRFEDRNFEGRAGLKEVIAEAVDGARILSSSVPPTDRSHAPKGFPQNPDAVPTEVTRAELHFALVQTSEGPNPLMAPVKGRRSPRGAPGAGAIPQPSATAVQSPTEAKSVPRTAGVKGPGPLGDVRSTPLTPAARDRSLASPRGDRLTELISTNALTPQVIALSLLIAFGLGALHALSPGHGKTLVAAHLVGSRGTPLHALLLGAVVTASHTIGVFALGFVTLYLSRSILPEKLFPSIELLSGGAIVAVGSTMFARRLRSLRNGAAHRHADGTIHVHEQDAAAHEQAQDYEHGGPYGPTHVTSIPEGAPTAAALLAMGVSGGILPCPSALVVLLSAIALNRVGFGLVLILAFSLGLASVLAAIGILVVRASALLGKTRDFGTWAFRVPVVSALLIGLLGLAISGKALRDIGLIKLPF